MKKKQNYYLSHTVALIGLMGAGKTTLGKHFAKSLSTDFVDSDEEIVKRAGISIREIFELSGEEKFRDIEQRVIKEVLSRPPMVLSTGGGAFISTHTREILNGGAITIWLRAKPETLLSRMENFNNRPLLLKGDPLLALTNLQRERKPYYQKAHVVIDTDNLSSGQSLKILISALKERDVLKLENQKMKVYNDSD